MGSPWLLCGVLLLVILLLLLKILFMKRSLREICGQLEEFLSRESNELITMSSADRHTRALAAQLNRQLRLLRKQRQQYLVGGRELKEAVTNISHDLRTPLTAVSGYLELLAGEEKSAETARYLAIIGERVEALKLLTEELFRYSVILSGENGAGMERVVLNHALEESIAAFYPVLKKRGITPLILMPAGKVVRSLNPASLSRVLSNLLNNAVNHSDGDLEISLTETGEITFMNTASGLSQVQVGQLFDRFFTVHNAEKSTGLGLEITRTLVEQMKGSISADYQHNKLSIRIQFPDALG